VLTGHEARGHEKGAKREGHRNVKGLIRLSLGAAFKRGKDT
jgi:hypothetical protein